MQLTADDMALVMAFRSYFGVERSAAGMLLVLYRAKGDGLTSSQLASALTTTSQMVNTMAHRLRQALDCESLDFERVQGYSLTEHGLKEVRDAISSMAASLNAAA